MQHKKGFTLIELMVTVAVIAILAAIALPSYSDYVTRSKFAEPMGILADLRVKMEQYYADNRRYSSDVGGATCGIPGGNVPVAPDGRYFTYTCTPGGLNGLGAQQFVLQADGVPAQGLTGIHFNVNHANAKATIVDASTEMANKGYAGAACWVRKKPSGC